LGNYFLAHFGPAAMRSATHLLPAVLLFALLALPACDNVDDDETSINGEWSAEDVDTDGQGAAKMSFVLSQSDGDEITGRGDFTLIYRNDDDGGTLPMEVDGTYDAPEVELTFTVRNAENPSYSSQLFFDGEVSGSGEMMEGWLRAEETSNKTKMRFIRD